MTNDITESVKTDSEITVYSKENCFQCRATTRHLDKAGVTYTLKKIDQDPDAAEEVRQMGFLAAPVVVANIRGVQTDWSGFNPDRLNEYIASHEPDEQHGDE